MNNPGDPCRGLSFKVHLLGATCGVHTVLLGGGFAGCDVRGVWREPFARLSLLTLSPAITLCSFCHRRSLSV